MACKSMCCKRHSAGNSTCMPQALGILLLSVGGTEVNMAHMHVPHHTPRQHVARGLALVAGLQAELVAPTLIRHNVELPLHLLSHAVHLQACMVGLEQANRCQEALIIGPTCGLNRRQFLFCVNVLRSIGSLDEQCSAIELAGT